VRVEHERRDRALIAFRMEVMLRRRERVEAEVLREDGDVAELLEHLLVALVVAPDRAETPALLVGARDRRQDEQVEFHECRRLLWRRLLSIVGCADDGHGVRLTTSSRVFDEGNAARAATRSSRRDVAERLDDRRGHQRKRRARQRWRVAPRLRRPEAERPVMAVVAMSADEAVE